MDSYMTVKGQIVIPSKIRRKFGIKEGTRVQVEVDEQAHRIILTPVTRDYIQHLRGRYKGKRLLAALAAEKKREREL
jgi:AbrB family looped-hinge helix DNA binding protein